MHISQRRLSFGLISALFLCASPSVRAETSTSYQLTENGVGYLEREKGTSPSFQIADEETIWRPVVMESTSFETTGTSGGGTSQSSTQESETGGSAPSGSTGGGRPRSSSSTSTTSSASSASSPSSEVPTEQNASSRSTSVSSLRTDESSPASPDESSEATSSSSDQLPPSDHGSEKPEMDGTHPSAPDRHAEGMISSSHTALLIAVTAFLVLLGFFARLPHPAKKTARRSRSRKQS